MRKVDKKKVVEFFVDILPVLMMTLDVVLPSEQVIQRKISCWRVLSQLVLLTTVGDTLMNKN